MLALVFDGTCGVCTRLARWVRRRDRAGRVLVLPSQRPGVLARYGLTREEADRSAWAVDPGGRRWEGAAAVGRVLAELGGPAAWVAAPYRIKPLGAMADLTYRWFAGRRSKFERFGVRPECDEPDAGCE